MPFPRERRRAGFTLREKCGSSGQSDQMALNGGECKLQEKFPQPFEGA